MISPKFSNITVQLILVSLLASNESLALASDGHSSIVRLSDPIETTAISETFGTPFPDPVTTISLQRLIAGADKFLGQQVSVSTEIAKVCQKKGCFFIAQDGDTTMRVSFKDYGFFLPTDSGGKQVDLFGVLTQKRISKKAAQHFAKDLGTPGANIAAGLNYEFVASSVRIQIN